MQPIKKLYRSVDDRIIAGVAGGIAEYFNIDPVLVRVVFIVLALIHGLGIILYIVLLFLTPKEGDTEMLEKVVAFSKQHLKKNTESPQENPAPDAQGQQATTLPLIKDKARFVGLAIMIVGGFALFNVLFNLSWFRWDIFWAIGVIIVGFYLIVRRGQTSVR